MPAQPSKRRAPDDTEGSATARPAKAQKTSSSKKPAPAKPAMPLSEFKDKARPIHIHVTHTPPSIEEKESLDAEESDAGSKLGTPTSPEAPIDPGLISSLTLLPSSFSTGSYGWKGSKKIVAELQNSEEGPNGREKVQVMLTINATVVGSKQSVASSKDEQEEEGEHESSEVVAPSQDTED